MDIDIRMIMPCDEHKRPVAPLNYLQWLFNCHGFNGALIRFLDVDKITYEEFDDFTYINFNRSEFLRYDIREDILYMWDGGGVEIKTVDEFIKYCEECKCRVMIEVPLKCTYGVK